MKKHTTTVLSAMVTGMDDRDDPEDYITLEAMNGLSKILAQAGAVRAECRCSFDQVEEDNVRAILLNISLRIRPCFEKAKVARDADIVHISLCLSASSACGRHSPVRKPVALWRRPLQGALL